MRQMLVLGVVMVVAMLVAPVHLVGQRGGEHAGIHTASVHAGVTPARDAREAEGVGNGTCRTGGAGARTMSEDCST